MNISPTPISPAKIHLVVGIRLGTFIVFFTNAHCWQWRIVSNGGEVFGHSLIYYTVEAAEKAGREWIAQGS
jgi:hypothetical protein